MMDKTRKRKHDKKYRQSENGKRKRREYSAGPAGRASQQRTRDRIQNKANVYYFKSGIATEFVLPWLAVTMKDRTCWLCGGAPRGHMHLDHNHETKEIRGWTHRACNMAEGLVRASPNPEELSKSLVKEFAHP